VSQGRSAGWAAERPMVGESGIATRDYESAIYRWVQLTSRSVNV
jgi:hypothetical protein